MPVVTDLHVRCPYWDRVLVLMYTLLSPGSAGDLSIVMDLFLT